MHYEDGAVLDKAAGNVTPENMKVAADSVGKYHVLLKASTQATGTERYSVCLA